MAVEHDTPTVIWKRKGRGRIHAVLDTDYFGTLCGREIDGGYETVDIPLEADACRRCHEAYVAGPSTPPVTTAPTAQADQSPRVIVPRVLNEVVRTLSAIVAEMVADRPPQQRNRRMEPWREDAAHVLVALDAAFGQIGALRSELSTALAESLRGTFVPYLAYDGLPPMTPQFHRSRKEWANDELRSDLRRAILSDPDTGESFTGPEVFARLEKVVSILGSNVKLTGCREFGIEPNEYCVSKSEPATMQIVWDAAEQMGV